MKTRSPRLVSQPLGVQGLVRYVLVMKLVDTGRARIGRVRIFGCCHYLEIIKGSGQAFFIQRPPISMEMELRLRREVGRLLQEHRNGGSNRRGGSG